MKLFSILALLAAFCSATLTVQGAILYRGRLTNDVHGTTEFDAGTAYDMTFNVYNVDQGGESLCKFEKTSVAIAKDGSFEVLLDSSELDEALTSAAGNAYVGLTLADCRELMPRRQLLHLPCVGKSRVALQPADKGKIDEVKSASLRAGNITARALVAKELNVSSMKTPLAIKGITASNDTKLDFSEKKLTLFGESKKITFKDPPTSVGQVLYTAPADGVALVYPDGEKSIAPIVLFCRDGEEILAPWVVKTAIVFYSFAAK